tara:strand:- start:1266 stop:2036 length:771 start_codon:yes stop_codon:yes gene_type:complete
MSRDASENIVPNTRDVLRHLNIDSLNNIENTVRQIVSNNDMVDLITSLIDTNEIPYIVPPERSFRDIENMILMPTPIRNSLLRFMEEGNNVLTNTLRRTLFENSGIKKVLSEKGLKTLKKEKYNNEIHKNNECPILRRKFEEGEEITVLPCDHCFQSEAILRWLKEEKAECPVCRYILDSEEKSRINEEENEEIIDHLQNRQTLINSIRRVNISPIDITQSRDFFREQIRLNHPMWPNEEEMNDIQQAILMSLSDN